jgi:hypothetical protein
VTLLSGHSFQRKCVVFGLPMRRKTRLRLFATGIACTLAGCVGSKPTSAPAEKQDSVAVMDDASSGAARPAGPPAPEVAIHEGRVLLDGAELVKVADLPPDVETIGALFDALATNTDPSATNLGLVLRADKDASVLIINAVLRTASAAGYTIISLCPSTGAPDETCSRLVLSDRSR